MSALHDYEAYVERKKRNHAPCGIDIDESDMSGMLFAFQKSVTRWALHKGRCCIFAGTGLGKTLMQIEFLRHIPGVRLIVAPLAVSSQTISEGLKIGTLIRKARVAADIDGPGIYVTNYDRIHLFEDVAIDAVVLDESSILKSHDGKYRQYLQDRFSHTSYRLACTATPSPNDYMELGTHAEFVGAMSRAEMLATYFVHDGADTSKWRLKKHAQRDFWRWVATWACVFSHPRDIGFEQKGYDLPPLTFERHEVTVESTIAGGLFGDDDVSASQVFAVLRESAPDRALVTARLVASDPVGSWLIWCNTNDEQDLIEKAIPGCVGVRGDDSPDVKEDRLLGFADGRYRILVTKPKIAGFGMNWQRCHQMIFCGVTYSFEQMYQAVRRSWRFGQKRPVTAHIVTCNAQESIASALKAKEEAFNTMAGEMRKHMDMEAWK